MKKLMMLGLSLLLVPVLVSLASGAGPSVPLPKEIEIVPPEPDIPPEIAAFSGARAGIWDGTSLEAVIIVEEVGREEVKLIYAWGDDPSHNVTRGWRRYIGKVVPSKQHKVEFGGDGRQGPKFTLEMKKDGKVRGVREFRGYYLTITFKPIPLDKLGN